VNEKGYFHDHTHGGAGGCLHRDRRVSPGVFAGMALKAAESLQLGYGRVPLAPVHATDRQHYTRGALLFFTVLVSIMVLRVFLYRGKSVTASGTWGCGFTQPTARMQYTGSSYAGSILEFFGPLAPLEENHPPIEGRFPAKPITTAMS
jgi:hydrogenase-4 component B